MANQEKKEILTRIVPSLPVEEILFNVAESVIKAQQELDFHSLASEIRIREAELDKFGVSAHWYTIPELTLDLRLAFELTEHGELTSQLVDAEYQSKYDFDVSASSLLKTRIVATPPIEIRGLSLLNEYSVLQGISVIKKIVEAYDQADTPYFSLLYRPFAAKGYEGGIWYIRLLDILASGETVLRAMIIVDDESGEVLRLWTEYEPPAPPEGYIVVEGLAFSPEESNAILDLVNSESRHVLDEEVALDVRAVDGILARREEGPIGSLEELSEIKYVGAVALLKLKAYIAQRMASG